MNEHNLTALLNATSLRRAPLRIGHHFRGRPLSIWVSDECHSFTLFLPLPPLTLKAFQTPEWFLLFDGGSRLTLARLGATDGFLCNSEESRKEREKAIHPSVHLTV